MRWFSFLGSCLTLAMLLTGCGSTSRPVVTAPPQSRAPREGGIPRGLRAAIYYVNDLDRARDWYNQALSTTPYLNKPYYVGYDIDGFELGLEPGESHKGDNVIAYWAVASVEAELKRLLALGAKEHKGVHVVNRDVKIASVVDPFGNILGIIENHHIPK
jgi:predicted enzyme related to lactoylglutathione lyase